MKLRSGNNIDFTILCLDHETSLANEVSHKLITENIYSKIISMPCQELFDQQNNFY